jgi:hypothetical protein
MDIQDIRRARLGELISRYGSQANFTRETGESQSEISGLLRAKSFGERKARKLEVKCNLPAGWFDQPLEATAPLAAGGKVSDSRASLTLVGDAVIVEKVEPQWMALVYVTQRELDLLSAYRRASDIGKSLVETAAESAISEDSLSGTSNQP